MFCIMCGLLLPVRAGLCSRCGTQSVGQSADSGVHGANEGATCAPCSHALADAARNGAKATAEHELDAAAKRPRDGAAESRRNGVDVNALGLLKGPRAQLFPKLANAKPPLTVLAGQHCALDYGVTKSYVATAGRLIPLGKELLEPEKVQVRSLQLATC